MADEPSTGIGRVGSLAGETLCGDRCGAVRILAVADEPSTGIGRVGSLAGEPSAGIGVVPCASLPWPMNPLQGSGVSERSRCGAVRILAVADEPSTGIGRVDRSPRTLCAGDRCGAVRILAVADEPSTGIGRVGALSLWCRAHPCRGR